MHHLEDATCTHFGLIGLVASALSALITILLCSTTDKYQNYRLTYILSVLVALLCAFLLVQPVYHDVDYEENFEKNSQNNVTSANPMSSPDMNNKLIINDSNNSTTKIAFVIIFTTVMLTSNLNVLIISRVSLLENKCIGSILILGSIAGFAFSAGLILVTDLVQLRGHFLLWPIVAFSFIIATSLTTIISHSENQTLIASYYDDGKNNCENRVEFKFVEKFLFGKKTLLDCRKEFETGIGSGVSKETTVVTEKVSTVYPFDTKDDDVFRNIRRCSLAPLGDSFLLKQYELDCKIGIKHFNNVTKIIPLEKVSENGLPNLGYRASFDNGNKSLILEIPSFSSSNIAPPDLWIEKKDLSWVHLKFIKKTLENDMEFVKLLMVLISIGIVSSFNQYSFIWLYSMRKDMRVNNYHEAQFLNLTAYILTCQQISEILLYYHSSTFKSLLKPQTSFTVILSTYIIRYLLYLTFEIYKKEVLLDETIIVVAELVQAFQTSWLNLIVFELSVQFANSKSDETLEKLANSSSTEKDENLTKKIKFSLTMTTICLFYCCVNGIGAGIGLITGGLLIDLYGFAKLWFICSLFASVASLFQFFVSKVQNHSIP